MDIRRDIPNPVKRQLRQEAGFGCCACGHPFIEYHHIIGFAESPHHDPKDMMILCPIHHHQATVGALSVDDQREMKEAPFNIRRGFANGQLVTTDNVIGVRISSTEFVGAGFKFLVDNKSLFALNLTSKGRLALTADVYDEEDKLLLSLIENEWITDTVQPWDLEFGYNWLCLRKRNRNITLEINARTRPVSVRADLWFKGQRFSIYEDSLRVDGVVKDFRMSNIALVGGSLHVKTDEGSLNIEPDPLFGEGRIVGGENPEERFEKAIQAYKYMKARALGMR